MGWGSQVNTCRPFLLHTPSREREHDQGVRYALLWAAVDLLKVLWETWCWGRDGGRWQQVPVLQQVDHSQGLRGAGLKAHGSQGRAQLGRTRTNRWLMWKGVGELHKRQPN